MMVRVSRADAVKLIRGAALPVLLALAGVSSLLAGWLPWPDFLELADRTVPILAFVLAMTIVTELSDDAGVFRAVTDLLARAGRGRVMLLWLLVVLLATVSTVFLSLDTTAVLVTPVVVLLALHVRIPPLPFALTTVWLANTASLLLPVSNLTNLLAQSQLRLSPATFAALVWAPAAVGVLLPLVLLWTAFRRQLGGSFRLRPAQTPKDRLLLTFASCVLIVLLPALVSGVPVVLPAGIAALLLLAVYIVRSPRTLRWSMLPWRPLLLTIGLFMVVQALHAGGLARLLARVAGAGDGYLALLQLGGLGALAANGVNNLPAYLALEPVAGSPLRLAALLIGVNLGPLITPWASLATLLWHERLQALGVRISWWAYAAAGLLAAALLLPLATFALWLAAGAP